MIILSCFHCSVPLQNLSHVFDERRESSWGFQMNLNSTGIGIEDPGGYGNDYIYATSFVSLNKSWLLKEKYLVLPFIGFNGVGVTSGIKFGNVNITTLMVEKSIYNWKGSLGLQACFNIADKIYLNMDVFNGYIYNTKNTGGGVISWVDPTDILEMRILCRGTLSFYMLDFLLIEAGALGAPMDKQVTFYTCFGVHFPIEKIK
jgi:hypothetical protein